MSTKIINEDYCTVFIEVKALLKIEASLIGCTTVSVVARTEVFARVSNRNQSQEGRLHF